MNKLILLCLTLFIGVTANVASAETLATQKGKQTGLNTASPNQMFTQRLGTEVVARSSKLAVISKRFSKASPTTSGVYTIGHVPKCNIVTTAGYVSVPATLVQSVPSTTISVAVSGISLLPTTTVASAPLQGAAASATASLAAISGCDRDVPVLMTVSGTITSGKIDFIIPYIPFNRDE